MAKSLAKAKQPIAYRAAKASHSMVLRAAKATNKMVLRSGRRVVYKVMAHKDAFKKARKNASSVPSSVALSPATPAVAAVSSLPVASKYRSLQPIPQQPLFLPRFGEPLLNPPVLRLRSAGLLYPQILTNATPARPRARSATAAHTYPLAVAPTAPLAQSASALPMEERLRGPVALSGGLSANPVGLVGHVAPAVGPAAPLVGVAAPAVGVVAPRVAVEPTVELAAPPGAPLLEAAPHPLVGLGTDPAGPSTPAVAVELPLAGLAAHVAGHEGGPLAAPDLAVVSSTLVSLPGTPDHAAGDVSVVWEKVRPLGKVLVA